MILSHQKSGIYTHGKTKIIWFLAHLSFGARRVSSNVLIASATASCDCSETERAIASCMLSAAEQKRNETKRRRLLQ